MEKLYSQSIKFACIFLIIFFFSSMQSMDEAPEKQNKKDNATSNGIRLMAAIGSGDLFAVDNLLAKNADPNTKVTSNSTSTCALRDAVKKRHNQITLALLVAKADPNKANKEGTTSLMEAVKPVTEKGSVVLVAKLKTEQVPTIQALLRHNADPTLQDVIGQRATDYTNDAVIKKLLESKTDQ